MAAKDADVTTSDITLKTHGVGPKARLTLDGEDISNQVLGLSLWIEPKTHEKHLDLHLIPGALDVELRDTHVLVDAETHDLLVRLGWTPPAHDKEATG